VLSIAIGQSLLQLLDGVVRQTDTHSGSLSGIDMQVLVHAASVVYIYLLLASVTVAACKRYYKDGSGAVNIVHILCVYGT
jgi:hypothetical protein